MKFVKEWGKLRVVPGGKSTLRQSPEDHRDPGFQLMQDRRSTAAAGERAVAGRCAGRRLAVPLLDRWAVAATVAGTLLAFLRFPGLLALRRLHRQAVFPIAAPSSPAFCCRLPPSGSVFLHATLGGPADRRPPWAIGPPPGLALMLNDSS